VQIVLNVLAPGSHLSPEEVPSGLIFSADAGTAKVPSQTITLYNPYAATQTYTSGVVPSDGGTWCSATPATGTINQTATMSVQVDFTKLTTPALYTCDLRLLFADGSFQTVGITALATTPGTSSTPSISGLSPDGLSPLAGNCSNWTVSLNSPQKNAVLTARQSTSLVFRVTDGCGKPVTNAGSWSVRFSNLDTIPALPTTSATGIYTGSWTPANIGPSVAQLPVQISATALGSTGGGG